MSTTFRSRRFACGAALSGVSLLAMGGIAAAQDTTATTQLDVGGASTTPTTQLDTSGGSTATTQLDVGGGTATTSAAPNQVQAGGGGTAGGSSLPFAGIALAGAAVVVVGASAERMRRQTAR